MNSFLHACCSTTRTRARRWSLRAHTCHSTSPYWLLALPRTRKYNSTDMHDTYGKSRSNRAFGTGTDRIHVQIRAARAPAAAHTPCCSESRAPLPPACSSRFGRSEQLLQARAACHRPTTAAPPFWPPPATKDAAFTVSMLLCCLFKLPGKSCQLPRAARQMV